MNERYYWLGLSMIRGIGPMRISQLIQYFGDAYTIWHASEKELVKILGLGKLSKKFIEQREKIDLKLIINKLQKNRIEYITLPENNYPEILKNIYDPPPVIFYLGENVTYNPAVAIIGSRRATSYGRKVAEKLAYELSIQGITVVSGMARGIDTHAHIGSLKAGGKTIAVMGSGLDHIYPPENRKLFLEIKKNGMVISEYPLGVPPYPGNFPQRNRIISGLCKGIVIVEASTKSGSLITADLALEQGRELFAIPGNIDREQSKGSNSLIKKGAKLVTDINDILEEIFIYYEYEEKKEKLRNPKLLKEEEEIVNILKEKGDLHINKIIEYSGKSASKVNTILLKLELKGLISQKIGKKYSLLGLQNLIKPL